jgi:hypothetical protein
MDVDTEPDDFLSLPAVERGREARRLALTAYRDRDWYSVYAWTKTWISTGGGAWDIDAWLLYVISSLLEGKPRNAVHSTDMALQTWIEAPQDRAVLRWVRAAVVHRWLNDPKTARAEYAAAAEAVPGWLLGRLGADVAACEAEASTSRKRKPSVGPAPPFQPMNRDFVEGPTETQKPGSPPRVWDELITVLDERQPA